MYLNCPITSIAIQLEMEKVDANVKKYREKLGLNISLNDLLIFSISKALEKHKEFNEGEKINVGNLVNFDEYSGEIFITEANKKEVKDIAKEFKDQAMELLRNKRLIKKDNQASIWITNLYNFGAYFSIPPIKTGTKCMLSLGANFEALNNVKQSKPRSNLIISYDSRIADCQKALLFLKEIKLTLEKPN
ncbi:MAG: 2-oxo acid dehydrogenase subunit E2 [archaeon]